MGNRRMNRQITEAELRKRFTKENTETIALRCLFCGNIDEVEAGFVDGRQCSVCKKHVSPIGYLKPKQNPHNNNQKLKKQVKSMDTKEHVDKLIVSLCGYIGYIAYQRR